MKTNPGKPLTLGALIESGYRAYGKRRVLAILRLAAKARLVMLKGQGVFLIP